MSGGSHTSQSQSAPTTEQHPKIYLRVVFTNSAVTFPFCLLIQPLPQPLSTPAGRVSPLKLMWVAVHRSMQPDYKAFIVANAELKKDVLFSP